MKASPAFPTWTRLRFSLVPQALGLSLTGLAALTVLAPQASASPTQKSSSSRAAERITPEVIVAQQGRASVVCVRTSFLGVTRPEFRNGQLQQPKEIQQNSLASGFVIDEHGYVLTTYSAIQNAVRVASAKIQVQLAPEQGSRLHSADLVSWVVEEDLALLKIRDHGSFHSATLGTSSDLMLAERLVLIANPYGQRHSVQTGFVSSLNGRLRVSQGALADLDNLLQMDIPVMPGASGGPVFNILGEVIGVATGARTDAHPFGYAIPIDRVQRVLDEQLFAPSSARAWLGFEVSDLPFQTKGPNAGVVVSHVSPGGPADHNGLSAGQILVSINGQSVTNRDAFLLNCLPVQPGQKLNLQVHCEGEGEPLSITGWSRHDGLLFERIGLRVEARLINNGMPAVRVTHIRPGGPASEVGFQVGDFLEAIGLEADGQAWRMPSPAELARFLTKVKRGTQLLVDVRRDEDGNQIFGGDEIFTGRLKVE